MSIMGVAIQVITFRFAITIEKLLLLTIHQFFHLLNSEKEKG
jgi:hypothetical protein